MEVQSMAKQKQQAVSDEEIIAALMTSGSIQQAAAAAGIAPRTLYDRMACREFKVLYSAAKADIVRQAVFTMNRKLSAAIETVSAIMEDESAPAGTRLQAAKVIIDNASKFAERLTTEEEKTGDYTSSPFSFDLDKW